MKWAVSVKLYEGFAEDGTLRPAGQTTRAQMAKLLNVLCGSVCEHAAAGTRGLCVVSKAVPPLALAGGGAVCGLYTPGRTTNLTVDKRAGICYDTTCVWTDSNRERCPSGLRSRS